MLKNPWQRRDLPTDQGRAVVTVAREARLSRSEVLRWTKAGVEALVRDATEGASVVFQVGMTKKWGREPSMQVVLLNGSSWVMPWPAFERIARAVAVKLARDLAQEEVLLELLRAGGEYKIESYVNPAAKRQRHAILTQARRSTAKK